MQITNIKVRVKNKKPKRKGRGTGSGLGKTSGRGHKGAGKRAGKKLPYAGFRGGNVPYFRKIPKRGFTSPNATIYQIVNLADIQERLKDSKDINPKILQEANLIKDENKPVKILANIKEEFKVKALFKIDKFSSKARELIEAAGGTAECLKR